MTDSPSTSPDADPADGPLSDPTSSTGAPPSVQPYTDPVTEQGARFAREADGDGGTRRPAAGGDSGGDGLSPDFLEPTQPS